jgi:hypothetical protein
MKKAKPVALIEAGSLSASPLAHFRWPSERLGPVKAPSFRLASRIANRIQAGHPVKDYREFDACTLIVICVPDNALARVLAELDASGISWNGKALVLCSAWLDSNELGKFAAHGAAVGSLSAIPGFEDARYLIEGDKLAVLEATRVVEHRQQSVIAIERNLKPFYLAALTCTGTAAFALVTAACECLRYAGVAPLNSDAIIEQQLRKTLRSYVRGGRRNYPAPRELSRQLPALASKDRALAAYVEQSCRLADRLVGEREKARAAASVR